MNYHRNQLLFTLTLVISLTGANLKPVLARGESDIPPKIVVTSSADTIANDGQCTLREAMTNVINHDYSGSTDCSASNDIITFDLLYPATITLTSSLPAITTLMSIEGPGADKLTISGDTFGHMITVGQSSTLKLSGLTLSQNTTYISGGAIGNEGTLNISYCVFSNNNASASGGAIENHGSSAKAMVTASTFVNNSAGTTGGAISNLEGATLTVTNSTFVGNNAAGLWGGGAIGNFDNSSLTVTYSTFSNNTAAGSGAAISNGGNSTPGGVATLQAVLLSANTTGANLVNCHNESGTLTDDGYNLEDGDTCGFGGTSLKNKDPLLGSLADNGSPTQTLALQDGSPAVGTIPAGTAGCGTILLVDQRGVNRPAGLACDTGAFELAFWIYIPFLRK
jgi:CSLREA domain-containing protein